MKSFLVILKNKSNAKLDMPLLEKHAIHLKNIHSSSNLVVCGPFADDSGAVLVIEANSENDADAIIQADPFIKEKFYANYSIKEFFKADDSNNWLMNHEQTLGELDRD